MQKNFFLIIQNLSVLQTELTDTKEKSKQQQHDLNKQIEERSNAEKQRSELSLALQQSLEHQKELEKNQGDEIQRIQKVRFLLKGLLDYHFRPF